MPAPLRFFSANEIRVFRGNRTLRNGTPYLCLSLPHFGHRVVHPAYGIYFASSRSRSTFHHSSGFRGIRRVQIQSRIFNTFNIFNISSRGKWRYAEIILVRLRRQFLEGRTRWEVITFIFFIYLFVIEFVKLENMYMRFLYTFL